MRYADRFSGHMDPDDPRSLAFAAGGCTWPTLQAFRLAICDTSPWGIFSGLANIPIVATATAGNQNHDFMLWTGLNVPPPIVAVTITKEWKRDEKLAYWIIDVTSGSPCGQLFWKFTRGIETCNRDYLIGESECTNKPPIGGFSANTQLLQVEWNETTRPDQNCPPPS